MRITADGRVVAERTHRPEYALLVVIAALSLLGASVGITSAQHSLRATTAATPGGVTAPAPTRAKTSYGTLPMSYEPNLGQVPGAARFIAHGTTETALLEPGRVVITPSSGGSPVVMQLVGAAQTAIHGTDALPGTVNYLVGRDRTQWHTGIPTYAHVTYANLYPGVDMVWHGTTATPEYDFVVAAGADPSVIRLDFTGARTVRVDRATGDLVVAMPKSTMRQRAPKIYQPTAAGNVAVSGHFVITGSDEVGFALAPYDRSRPLVIDPTFTYSTLLGGSADESGYAIAVDGSGSTYVAGSTCSADFPTLNPLQSSNGNAGPCGEINTEVTLGNAFIAKLNPLGTGLVYSTYLGGSSPTAALGITTDDAGDAYVTGMTAASDFPTTTGALQPNCVPASTDAFASELAVSGSTLVYSTCLGGTPDQSTAHPFTAAQAIQLRAGRIYLGGYTASDNFPVTSGALQTASGGGGEDAFISEINPAGGGQSDLVYSTYLGGSGREAGSGQYSFLSFGLAVDAAGVIYVAGSTSSTDFPVTPGAYQTALAGPSDPLRQDAFVTKIDPSAATGHQLVYSTYLGGQAAPYSVAGNALGSDGATGLVLGPPMPGSTAPTIYVAGVTTSADFPVTAGAVEAPPIFCADLTCFGFLSRLSPAGGGSSDLLYSTYLGATGAGNQLRGLGIDPSTGNAIVAGWTLGSNFPMKAPIQGTCGCFTSLDAYAADAWVAEVRMDPTGSAASNLVFATFVGGTGHDAANAVAVDAQGSIYVTGETSGIGPAGKGHPQLPFPTTPGAFQPNFAGGAPVPKFVQNAGPFPLDAFVTKIAFADLSVSVAAPGSVKRHTPLAYTVTAANAGPSPVSAVVSDVLPKGVAFVSGSPGCSISKGSSRLVTCAVGVIASGSSVTLTIVAKPGAVGTLSNTITVDGDAADVTPADNAASVSTTVN